MSNLAIYFTPIFKLHGFSLQSDASNYLKDVLSPINEVEREDFMDRLLDAIQKQNLSSNIISTAVLKDALKECDQVNKESCAAFQVIDAFTLPKYVYNNERKKFLLDTDLGRKPPSLYCTADDLTNLFCDRYHVLCQRTTRHKLFTPSIPGNDDVNMKKFKLRNVEFLLGCTAKLKDIIVLGMITQIKESKYYLEDPTGAVVLDLSETMFHTGLFTENSFVLAEGWYQDDIFHVTAFGFPPAEPSKTTRAYFGNINFFGGPSLHCSKSLSMLVKKEKENENAMFLFLSDVWLDQESVLKKLETMFIGFSDSPPTCIVFAGSFCSNPFGPDHLSSVCRGLTKLASIISQFPYIIQQTKFVFVPSINDLGVGQILPRPALPSSIFKDFIKIVPNAVFASNPCRIQYCSQEIIILRQNLVGKMCRNLIKSPSGNIPEQFVKSMISQAHFSPLPLSVSPVHWMYDHALRLYPLPDLVVFCDQTIKPFEVSQQDCLCICPGSFGGGDFCFKAYYPSNKSVEDCKIENQV